MHFSLDTGTPERQAGSHTRFLSLPRGWQGTFLVRMPYDVMYETVSGGGQRPVKLGTLR